MGRDESSSLFLRQCGMLAALRRVRTVTKKTPLLVDRSAHHAVDTFYKYEHAEIVDAKRLFMSERAGTPRPELMEGLRRQLVNAMRHGLTLYIRLENSACDFVGRYSAPDTFPLELFDAPFVEDFVEEHGSLFALPGYDARAGRNLAESGHPLAMVLRDPDTLAGAFTPRFGFTVVVCSHFAVSDFHEFLDGRLPMQMLQPIAPLVQ